MKEYQFTAIWLNISNQQSGIMERLTESLTNNNDKL